MSYTRGQETFWNTITMTFQNVYRLVWTCVFVGLISGISTFYLLVPSSFWHYVAKGFVWSREAIRNRGLFYGISSLDSLYSYEKNLLLMHKGEVLTAITSGCSIAVVTFVLCLYFFQKRGAKLVKDVHISGSKLISDRAYTKQARRLISSQEKEIRADIKHKSEPSLNAEPFCPTADKLEIPYQLLSNHVAVIGSTGTGKSTVIKHKIEHSKSVGDKGIVLDINGELYSQVGSEKDVVLSLFDKRSAFWDFEFEKAQNLNISPIKIAEYLIPTENAREAVWWKAPRIMMEELIVTCKTSAKLWDIIKDPTEDLIDHLYGLAVRAAGKKDTRTYYNMVISLILDCRFFGFLNYWPTRNEKKSSPFSILEWTQNTDPRWVFIIVDEKDIPIMSPLLKLWFNIAIHGILSRKPYNDLPAIALVIDEMRSVGKLDLLPSAVNRMRKYGGQGFFGWQSNYQLQHLYGASDASSIVSGIGTQFIFNIASEKEAKEHSQAFGNQEVKRKSFSVTYGLTNHGDRETLGEQIVTKPVVSATEIMSLPNGHCYVKSRAIDPVKTRIKYKNWTDKLPLHRDFHHYPTEDINVHIPETLIEKSNPDPENILDPLPPDDDPDA